MEEEKSSDISHLIKSFFMDKNEKSKHKDLLEIVKRSLWDYEPFGSIDRDSEENPSDCSCGCVFFLALKGKLGNDWGVCSNPKSHRCGLLTFEHQGCTDFKRANE